MPGAAVPSGGPHPCRAVDTGLCRGVPGHPSKHGANVDVHRSRPPWPRMSGLWRGEAMAIVGKGIDAWRDAMCELRLESRKTTDTVRDPCWHSAPTPRPAASASSAPGSVRLPPLPLAIIRHVSQGQRQAAWLRGEARRMTRCSGCSRQTGSRLRAAGQVTSGLHKSPGQHLAAEFWNPTACKP